MASLVHIVYNSNSIMKCITVEGHAGIKKSGEGYEVCIALSVLTQAMYKALLSTIGKKFLEYKTDDGLLSLELINIDKLDTDKKKEYELVSNGYLIGIKSLIKEYPDFIKYKEEYKNGT
ncbi:ribosomal-processing cysteine protease Prp [Brachyspira innocens]|uniref:Ribosomal processing cysteine protease Prp n=1 Tax=Brachyspira innocens TaxID=13264 RepID=A0ABT8YW36_9SPIR|nr:ribosomal-processing cysteine protease Prp [Brachyspira innocens]MDO6993164.1 ribosomal-processing cysteine protease Prp [Brachyspira innocens]MDO7020121.1 ribosomal-processing cysteine protease Prp [Brachyspira innocens]